jgi:Ca-activated chloride channel family protein
LELGWPEYLAITVLLLMIVAEYLHDRRVRRLGRLAFGPGERPRSWTMIAPLARVLAISALAWGFMTLLMIDPKIHNQGEIDEKDQKHLVLVIDVSPSMYLQDAGVQNEQERRKRVSDVLRSLFERIPVRQYKISVVAVYSEARPVIEDSHDVEVVRHLLEETPLYHAFKPGKTDLFKGLEQAATMAKSWNPKSTIVVLLTDGDSVPPKGMPRMPAAVSKVLVVGVGDERTGRFIDGHQSRQDVNTLRQVANRLGGIYHNGNEKHITSQTVNELLAQTEDGDPWEWNRREIAMLCVAMGSAIIAILPVLLHFGGTGWNPGKSSKILS